jgi:hypothetical protein
MLQGFQPRGDRSRFDANIACDSLAPIRLKKLIEPGTNFAKNHSLDGVYSRQRTRASAISKWVRRSEHC